MVCRAQALQHQTMRLPLGKQYTLSVLGPLHGAQHDLVLPSLEIAVHVHPAPALQSLPEVPSITSPALVSAVLN